MKRLLIIASLLGSTLLYGQVSPMDSQAIKDALKPLHWMAGNWEGSGWVMTPQRERATFQQTEAVTLHLDQAVLFVEGHGLNDAGESIHDALAMIHFQPESEDFTFRAYTAQYGPGDFRLEVLSEHQARWYRQASGREIRYTITHTEADQWHEFGEIFIAEQGQWFPIMEMTLTRAEE